MCLAVPLKLINIENNIGTIEVAGIRRKVNLSLVDNPRLGDHVIVHAGFAITIMDEKEAEKTISIIRECLELEEKP